MSRELLTKSLSISGLGGDIFPEDDTYEQVPGLAFTICCGARFMRPRGGGDMLCSSCKQQVGGRIIDVLRHEEAA